MNISKEDFEDYVSGWLIATFQEHKNGIKDLDMNNMKAALGNALNMIEDYEDGILAYKERKEYYKNEKRQS